MPDDPTRYRLDSPWSLSAAEVARGLEVETDHGLSAREASARCSVVGHNRLREAQPAAWWKILARQLKSLVVALLGAASVVSFAFGEYVEAAAIVAVLAINTLLGFVAELRAVRSMEALRRLGTDTTRVRRDGRDELIPAELVVPGDVVLFEGGDRIAADLRVVEAAQLESDESVLTGESLPVAKEIDALPADTELHERTNMLFKGNTVTHGAGVGIVVATGMASQLGRIAELVEEAHAEATPLERRLDELGRRLIVATLLIAAAAAIGGILAGKDTFLMVQTGIALAVAAIPEGLPIVATIALARGMWRMAQRNAVINRLAAVETLGATTLILTDKTGTLTENRLAVRKIVTDAGTYEFNSRNRTPGTFLRDNDPVDATSEPLLGKALRVAAYCNDASLGADGDQRSAAGDPLEIALLAAAAAAGFDRDELLARHPEEREEAFDPSTKMMATFHRVDDHLEVAVKGAAEALLERAQTVLGSDGPRRVDESERARWQRENQSLAAEGFRVLGVATKQAGGLDEDPYGELSFIGLIALLDPPRADAADALQACRDAGIRVVMLTGDQAPTASFIARSLGMIEDEEPAIVHGRDIPDAASISPQEADELRRSAIFARVDPEQKLDLISLHQQAGEVVAMTGDGVNDAPALKKADIGVAMGKRGTPVAQEASDMVLTDDSLASIVAAVRQGRVIFANIRKFVVYLMSCNVSEVLVVSAAVAFDVPLPLLPLQILFLNLVTDVFPALALALGEGDPGLMSRPPRDPAEPILGPSRWLAIVGYAGVITVSVLVALLLAISSLGLAQREAVTVSFATLAMAQLWHVFNLRDPGGTPWRNDVVGNPWIWAALALCVTLIVGAVHLPGLSAVLRTADPGAAGWGVILGMSLVPWLVGQAVLLARGRGRSDAGTD